MKYPLLVSAIGLLLVACSDKQPEKAATAVATPVAASGTVYLKATPVRPAEIRSTQSLPNACALDFVNDGPAKDASISDKAKIKLVGWAGNLSAGTSPKQVFVELEGASKVYVSATIGIRRPDVADHFKKPGLAYSGWLAYADLSDVAGGTYKARVIQVEGNSGLVCDSNISIVIK